MAGQLTTSAQAAQADYQLSDDEGDELFVEDEDVKPSNIETSQILKGQLQEPRYKTVSLRQLHDLIHVGGVNLAPEYQREVVWSKDKQMGLIESLFLNFYVPPVIFAVDINEETGEEERVCIDGKQRCTSVMNFYDGKIPFKSPSGHKFWYTTHGVRGGQVLSPALKRKFDQISLQVVEYPNPTKEEQRDIFQRVQLGMPLSSAERLQALGGEMSSWIRDLDKRFILAKNGFVSYLPEFDIKRARSFQILTAFVYMAHEGKQIVPTAVTENKFLQAGIVPEPRFKAKIEAALTILLHIAREYFDQSFGVVDKRVAPVEFWFACLIVYKRLNVLSTSRLASEIGEMRRFIRGKWVDIRANTHIHRDLYDFMENTVPNRRIGGEKAAIEEFPELHAKLNKKRRRDGDDSGDDEDDPNYYQVGNQRGARASDVMNGRRSNL